MKSFNLYLCGIGSGANCHKIKVDPFFIKLQDLFPTREFMIFDDGSKGSGPFIFYPKTSDWVEYKKGYKLGENMRKRKNVKKEHLSKLKKQFSDMPDRKHVDAYKKCLTITGFYEGLLEKDMDIIALTNWKGVMGNIKFQLEFMEDDLYDNLLEYHP